MILLNALAFALAGFAWSCKLTQPGEIAGFWSRLWFRQAIQAGNAPAWKYYLAAPLWYCPACVAGQMAFWGQLIPTCNVYQATLTALCTTGLAMIITRIYQHFDG